jgi:hypothetical protein
MGVDDPKRRRFQLEILDQPAEDEVLHHIGEIAGMEGVAVVHGSAAGKSGGRFCSSAAQWCISAGPARSE